MAANYGVQKSTINGVLSWYEKQDQVKFAIYRGNKENESYLSGGYHGNDKEQGYDALQNFLSEIESNDYNIYFLKLLPDTAKSKLSTPGITFQLYSANNSFSNSAQGSNQITAQLLHEVLNEVRTLRAERLQQLEEEEEEEEEQEPDQNNILAGFINQPQMQNLLIGMLQNLFTKQQQPQAIAGIETDFDAMQKNIELLMQKGVTAADIAKLAAMEQGQINFLLSMLRK